MERAEFTMPRLPSLLKKLSIRGNLNVRAVLIRAFILAFATIFCVSTFAPTTAPTGRYNRGLVNTLYDSMRLQNGWNRSDSISELVESSDSANQLPTKGNLFCFVITATKYHHTRVPAVQETWLSRCDRGQFFTNTPMNGTDFPYSTVFAGIPDKYEYLFYKTVYALHYIYNFISKDFDWYYKADDDTYVIVEHLKEYLATLDPSKPYYIGYRMRPYLDHGYNSGGSGYVISKAALKLFDEQLFRNHTLCPDDVYEDSGVGRCFSNIGIFPVDTRNAKGQQRFNAYRYDDIYEGKITNDWIFDPQILGIDSIGDDLISLHHITPPEMRIFDQLLYRVKPPKQKQSVKKEAQEKLLAKYIF